MNAFFRLRFIATAVIFSLTSFISISESEALPVSLALGNRVTVSPSIQNLTWRHLPLKADSCDSFLLPRARKLYGQSVVLGGPTSHSGKLGVLTGFDGNDVISLNDYFSSEAVLIGMDPAGGWAIIGVPSGPSREQYEFFQFDFTSRTKIPLQSSDGCRSFRESGHALSASGDFFVVAEIQQGQLVLTTWETRHPSRPAMRYETKAALASINYRATGLAIGNDGMTFAMPYREQPRGGFSRTQVMKVGARSGRLQVFRPKGAMQVLSADGGLLITRSGRHDYQTFDLSGRRPQLTELKNIKSIVQGLWRVGPGDDGMNPVRIHSSQTSPDGRWVAVEFYYESIHWKSSAHSGGATVSSGRDLRAVARWDRWNPSARPEIFYSMNLDASASSFAYNLRDDGRLLLGTISLTELSVTTSDDPQQVLRLDYLKVLPKQYSPYRGLAFSSNSAVLGIALSDSVLVFDLTEP